MSILAAILRAKRRRLQELRRERPWSVLESDPVFAEERRSLAAVLRRQEGPVRILAEIKRASPSAGEIRPGADAEGIAASYRDAGASGISLVTEEDFFQGRPDDLPRVRSVGLPVLMKDFLVDPYQVAWARALGADAVLLIAAIQDRTLLDELRAAASELGLEVLVEVHAEAEVDDAVRLGPDLLGVNHRDLQTFEVDLDRGERILPLLPAEVPRLAESGIRHRADLERLGRAGFDGVLVGESLMRAPDPGDALRRLRGEGPISGPGAEPTASGGGAPASDPSRGRAAPGGEDEIRGMP